MSIWNLRAYSNDNLSFSSLCISSVSLHFFSSSHVPHLLSLNSMTRVNLLISSNWRKWKQWQFQVAVLYTRLFFSRERLYFRSPLGHTWDHPGQFAGQCDWLACPLPDHMARDAHLRGLCAQLSCLGYRSLGQLVYDRKFSKKMVSLSLWSSTHCPTW